MEQSMSELEAATDPKVVTPDWREIFKAMQATSAEVRADNRPETFRYGPGPRGEIDLHRQDVPAGAPALVFFHGGGWALGCKEDMSLMAPPLNEAGIAYLAPNYPLSPASTLAETLPVCRDAVAWVYRNAGMLGIDRDRICLGGASAGAHIAAHLLTLDWTEQGLPADAFKSGLLLSGIYELTPMKMLRSYDYLGLGEGDVEALSPLKHVEKMTASLLVAWAGTEPQVIHDQSVALLERAKKANLPVRSFVEMGRNHFDFAFSLADGQSELSRKIRELIL